MQTVYVVHGFGNVVVFATRRNAVIWQAQNAKQCEIAEARVNTSLADADYEQAERVAQ